MFFIDRVSVESLPDTDFTFLFKLFEYLFIFEFI